MFLYISFIRTIKQKSVVSTQKIMWQEYKHTSKESQQTRKDESKRRRKKQRNSKNSQKTINKTAISMDLSIMTVNMEVGNSMFIL